MCGDSSPVNPHLSLFISEYFASEMQKNKKYCLLELKIIISEHLFKISQSWQIPNMGTKYNINFFLLLFSNKQELIIYTPCISL